MEIKPLEEVVESRRYYAVEGARPIPWQYHKGSIIPDRAEVIFVRQEFVSLRIAGPVAKQDGTPGVHSGDNRYNVRDLRDVPEWARPLVEYAPFA